jgi:hypothetical protein
MMATSIVRYTRLNRFRACQMSASRPSLVDGTPISFRISVPDFDAIGGTSWVCSGPEYTFRKLSRDP